MKINECEIAFQKRSFVCGLSRRLYVEITTIIIVIRKLRQEKNIG
jgi:hypothetical protein